MQIQTSTTQTAAAKCLVWQYTLHGLRQLFIDLSPSSTIPIPAYPPASVVYKAALNALGQIQRDVAGVRAELVALLSEFATEEGGEEEEYLKAYVNGHMRKLDAVEAVLRELEEMEIVSR